MTQHKVGDLLLRDISLSGDAEPMLGVIKKVHDHTAHKYESYEVEWYSEGRTMVWTHSVYDIIEYKLRLEARIGK